MEAQKVRFKARSYFKDKWWEGYYVYSSIDDKHYIVQDAQQNGDLNQFVNFCHYSEVDPATLMILPNHYENHNRLTLLTKHDVLQKIVSKIDQLESKNKFNVDTIDIIALKELYNDIAKY